jgi:uncharacterized membrane protein
MARKSKFINIRNKKSSWSIVAILLVVAVVAWVLSIPAVAMKAAPMVGSNADQFGHVADTIFTFAVAIVFFVLAFLLGAVPVLGFLLVMVGIAVLYHGIRKFS